MFQLHPQLIKDTVVVCLFKLCTVLLHKDANYPWVILVPRRPAISEVFHLTEEDQLQLTKESSYLSEVMVSIFAPKTMNIAALGNVVPQLHVHHVARFEDDPAWPGAIWGAKPAKSYDEHRLTERLARLHASLIGEAFEAACGVNASDDGHDSFTP